MSISKIFVAINYVTGSRDIICIESQIKKDPNQP